MRITNEQIAAEIADLTAEADRMVASAKVLFLESAKLKAQAEHFKRLLELRTQAEHHPNLTSYILIGFVRESDENGTLFCAVTWKGRTASPSNVQILLTPDWMKILPNDTSGYVNDLLKDWANLLPTEPETIIVMVADLSVGPIRTMDQGMMHEERVSILIRQKLGDVLHFPSSVPPIKQQSHSEVPGNFLTKH